MEHYKTGFALSGGFIRGFAHLGALQALFEQDIRPDIIAGVSAGSLAGVFTADGYEPHETLQCFSHLNFLDFTRPAWNRAGLMKLDLLIDFLRKHIRAKNIEDLRIPLIITATDFHHGTSVHFRTGSVAERVAASCCLPPLFSAIEIDGTAYVDGGVFMNLPVAPLREICDRVVAVNVSPLRHTEFKKNVISVSLRTFHFMSNANSQWARRNADLLIEPENLYEYGNTELNRAEEIFMCGYRSTKRLLESKYGAPRLKA